MHPTKNSISTEQILHNKCMLPLLKKMHEHIFIPFSCSFMKKGTPERNIELRGASVKIKSPSIIQKRIWRCSILGNMNIYLQRHTGSFVPFMENHFVSRSQLEESAALPEGSKHLHVVHGVLGWCQEPAALFIVSTNLTHPLHPSHPSHDSIFTILLKQQSPI
mgnify:CR=1 FL=1